MSFAADRLGCFWLECVCDGLPADCMLEGCYSSRKYMRCATSVSDSSWVCSSGAPDFSPSSLQRLLTQGGQVLVFSGDQFGPAEPSLVSSARGVTFDGAYTVTSTRCTVHGLALNEVISATAFCALRFCLLNRVVLGCCWLTVCLSRVWIGSLRYAARCGHQVFVVAGGRWRCFGCYVSNDCVCASRD